MSERDQRPDRPDGQEDSTRQLPAPGDEQSAGHGGDAAPQYGTAPEYPPVAPGPPAPAQPWSDQVPPTAPYAPPPYPPAPPSGDRGWTPTAGSASAGATGPEQAWGAVPPQPPGLGAPPPPPQGWAEGPAGPQGWAPTPPGQYPAPPASGGWSGGGADQTWGPAPGYGRPASGYGQPAPTGADQPPPGYGAPAAQPSPRGGNGGLIALLLVAAVVLAGAGTGAYFLLRSDGDPTEQTAADRAATARTGDTAGSGGADSSGGTSAAACDQAPEVTVVSASRHAGELAVDVEFTSACADGDLLDGESVLVTIAQQGTVVAANVFDFSRSPVELGTGQTVERRLGFGAGDFLLPPQMITAPLTATVEREWSGAALPSGAASDALDLLVAEDTSALRSVEGRWLPQVSAKRPGLVAPSLLGDQFPGEVHWDAETILAEHLALREKYPDAKLLYSGDWSTYDLPDFYVTVIADPQRSADATLSWCRAERLGRDDCLAKIVSDSQGPDGSTKLQRD